MRRLGTELETYLQHLRNLPFVRSAIQNVKPTLDRHDFSLTVRTPKGTHRIRTDERGFSRPPTTQP